MNSGVRVSVVIPVYNAERYLRACLDAVLGQSLKEIEVICVDDGSTDGSFEILNEYANLDSRMKVLRQENLYAGVARNAGFEVATGKYVIFLDADDFFETDMLQTAYATMENSAADICVFNCDLYDVQTKSYRPCTWSFCKEYLRVGKVFNPKEPPYNETIFRMFNGWAWDKVFRSDFVRDNNLQFQNLRSTNDMYFTYIALAKAEKIVTLDKVFVHQRVNIPTSISRNRSKSWTNFHAALMAMKDELDSTGLYNVYEKAFLNLCANLSLWQMNSMHGQAYVEAYEFLNQFGLEQMGLKAALAQEYVDKKEFAEIQQIINEPMLPEDLTVDAEKLNGYVGQGPCLVSIIMPSLNVGKYMRQCLESVMNQTLKSMEIICVDAGSTDGTLEIIEECAACDARIRLIRSEKKSYGYQMNLGLAAAKGKYIGIVETDDFISEDMYATLCAAAEQYQAEVVKANNIRTSEAGDEFGEVSKGLPYNKIISPKDYRDIFMRLPSIWNGLYSREFLNKNRILFAETPGASYQDTGFILKVWLCVQRLLLLKKPFYHYRVDNENSSVKSNTKAYCLCDEFDSVREFLMGRPQLRKEFGFEVFARKIAAYAWNYNRLIDDLRLDFLYRIREEFVQDTEESWVDLSKLPEWQKRFVKQVVDIPEVYYYSNRGEVTNDHASECSASIERCDSPAISVIIYCLNGMEEYIGNCLDSLLKQTMDRIEILCIVEGEQNPSMDLVLRHAEKDHRIQVVEETSSTAKAWKMAVASAKAEYVIFLDGTSFLCRDAMRILADAVKQQADMVLFHGLQLDRRGRSIKTIDYYKNEMIPRETKFDYQDIDESKMFVAFQHENWGRMYRKNFVSEIIDGAGVFPGVGGANIPFSMYAISHAKEIFALRNRMLISNTFGGSEGQKDPAELIRNLEKAYIALNLDECCGGLENSFINGILPILDSKINAINNPLVRRAFVEELDASRIGVRELLSRPQHMYCNNYLRMKMVGVLNAAQWKEELRRKKASNDYEIQTPYRSNDVPKVSVIIPVYNAENYLAECLDSVLGQTLANIEVIGVNDGSTDNSLEILLDYAGRDARLCVVDQPNAGQSNARNHGVSLAKGEYIYFIDSDDTISAETLERLTEKADAEKLDAVFFDSDIFYDEDVAERTKGIMQMDNYIRKHDYGQVYTGVEYIVATSLNDEYRMSPCMQMIRRSLWSEHDLKFYDGIVHEDNLYTFAVLVNSNRVSHVNIPYYHRRLRDDSTMTQHVTFNHSYGYFVCYTEMQKLLRDLTTASPEQKVILYGVANSCLSNAISKLKAVPVEERFYFYALPTEEYYAFNSLVFRPANAELARVNLNRQLQESNLQKNKAKSELSGVSEELDCIKKSVSFRAGRTLTAIPRRARDFALELVHKR